ncbi:unnamed protein product, partial [marine sediment metagenome]
LNKEWLKSISEHLHHIFVFMGHWWSSPEKSEYIPSPEQIAERIKGLWRDLPPEEDSTTSTGGLTVYADTNGDPIVYYSRNIEFYYNLGDPYVV